MAFKIIKRAGGSAPKKKVQFRAPRVASPSLNFRFDDRPVQFPEDVRMMRGWLRAMGHELGERECAALWRKLSRDFYPFPRDPGESAWLVAGRMYSLVKEHAEKYLVPTCS